MSSITVNTFPSLHSFTAPRSWFLAIIVLLHLGFFWALSNGLSKQIFDKFDGSVMVPVPQDLYKSPRKPAPLDNKPIETNRYDELTIPAPTPLDVQERDVIGARVETEPHTSALVVDAPPQQPVVVEPEIGARGLSEPVYPSAAIRLNQTGTVILSVQVLENGRVGEVRVEQSSGYARLDESAMREARLWRFKPGTHDGIPTAMWKQIPITFRLQN